MSSDYLSLKKDFKDSMINWLSVDKGETVTEAQISAIDLAKKWSKRIQDFVKSSKTEDLSEAFFYEMKTQKTLDVVSSFAMTWCDLQGEKVTTAYASAACKYLTARENV